jgi:EAL and modified HD-GYP domain-containing signal transduction protein
MIYSKSVSKNKKVSPLMLMIKNRIEIMECVLKEIKPDVRSNMLGQAYFVGVLSLVNTIFDAKIELILDEMNVDETIKDALLYNEGMLGDIYLLVKDMEIFNTKGIDSFAKKYELDRTNIERLNLRSMQAVNIFEDAVSVT